MAALFKTLACLLFFMSVAPLKADSLYYELPLVEVSATQQEDLLSSTATEALISSEELDKQAPNNLLSAVNSLPGVRMEERSPGSYRFSIRGSLLRSPFGVRNVKFYLSDWPLTDGGGNTYLNSLDISGMHSVRILRGPASGLLGANTGGVVVFDPFRKFVDSLHTSLSLTGGSFGFFHQHAFYGQQWQKASITLNQSYQRSDGYRDHSAMQRAFVQGTSRWHYRDNATIKAMFFYSDLEYETPGGLTLEQLMENPRSSRPATPTTPGAAEQKAGVMNKTGFIGLTHQRKWKGKLGHSISAWGSFTDFQNPFITNYEQRKEGTYGLRTYADVESTPDDNWWLKATLGGEWQQTPSRIDNFGNNQGVKDTLQVADRLRAQQAFAFSRLQTDFRKKLLLEASLSVNFFDWRYKRIYPQVENKWNKRSFEPPFMPKLSVSYSPVPWVSFRGIISRGFSVPTLAEIRASDNQINTGLQPEKGINYEVGIRIRDRKDIFWLDAAFFRYRLKDAIVRQVNEQGEEFFVNAGGTKQPGTEITMRLQPIQNQSLWLRNLHVVAGFAWNGFRFDRYRIGENDFSNNRLTGTPRYTASAVLDVRFDVGFGGYIQYYYASSIPLNDANSVWDDAYHILQAKVDWEKTFERWALQIYLGADNLLNQLYSLGNDLNAFGGRYYNPAPERNYYGGVRVSWGK